MKNRLLIVLGTVVLAGCSHNSVVTKTVDFDRYSMEIGEGYEEQPTLENYNTKLGSRQIVLFGKPTNLSGFNENIVVTKVPITSQTSNLSAIANIALESIDTTFGAYDQKSLKKDSLECVDDKIDAYLHSYQISQGIYNKGETYYLTQYYFINNSLLYIVSGISETIEEQTNFATYFKSIKCK